MSSTASMEASRIALEAVQDECCTSESIAESDAAAPEKADREALQKVQSALRTKIQELEAAEAEEKEVAKAAKRVVREVQKMMSSKEHTLAEKVELFEQKFIERVNEHMQTERMVAQIQRKLDKVTAERAALSEEVRRLMTVNSKLQDLCRTLQSQNKSVVSEAQEKASAEAQHREELSQRMETAMKDISERLEEHSAESQKCMNENLELRAKLEKVGQFCQDMEHNHKEQLVRKETQISFLRERMQEQTELLEHYSKTEQVLQEKCSAAEAARDTYCKQLEDAKERINGFCESFEKSNAAFKQLQDQVDVSHKIQKKMQQESDLLKKRSDLVQKKSERLLAENEQLLEQVDGMRGKLEHSVSIAEHNKVRSQKGALEKLCRVLQAEIKDARKKRHNSSSHGQPTSHPTESTPTVAEATDPESTENGTE